MGFTDELGRRARRAGPGALAAMGAGALALLVVILNRRKISTTIRNAMNGSYFTISELCASATARAQGIDNTPTEAVRKNLQGLITNALDPLREAYGKPIVVNSGYRCARLNAAVGGVANSQHLTGEAADIRGEAGTRAELVEICRAALRLGNYDQLIFEEPNGKRWLHISWRAQGNRKSFLLYRGGAYATLSKTAWEDKV